MTDFDKLFNAFKEVGIKMIVAKDKSRIILEEDVDEDLAGYHGGEYEYIDGSKYADGYCGFCCIFDFDENGTCEGYNIIE